MRGRITGMSGEKTEKLGGGCVCFCDEHNKICYDPLLLASFVREGTDNILDLCSGNGIIPLLLWRNGCRRLASVEINEAACELARRGTEKSEAEINIICGDVRNIDALVQVCSFDAVTCNPPYFDENSGERSFDPRIDEIRHDELLKLREALSAANYALKPGGHLYICYAADNAEKLRRELIRCGLTAVRRVFVRDSADKQPFMVMCDAVKGPGMPENLPDMILRENGVYTDAVKKIFEPED